MPGKTNKTDYEKLWAKAKKLALRKGWSFEEAEDFAQEACLSYFLKGRRNLEWVWIDYFRRKYGHSRSKITKKRINIMLHSLNFLTESGKEFIYSNKLSPEGIYIKAEALKNWIDTRNIAYQIDETRYPALTARKKQSE